MDLCKALDGVRSSFHPGSTPGDLISDSGALTVLGLDCADVFNVDILDDEGSQIEGDSGWEKLMMS